MYGMRAKTLRERGAPVAAWRQWCFYGGLVLMVATLVSPLAHIAEELFLAHMLEHLLLADLGALLIVLGVDRPAAAAGPERTRPALAARLHAPRGRADGLDGELLPLAPARALPERGLQRRRARAAAHPVRLVRDRDVDGAARPAAEAGLVRQRGEDRLHHRRAADRQRAGQRAAVVQRRALPPLRRRPGRMGHHRRQRPERGGRDHDDRGLDRHHRPVLLAVPARRARERGEAGAGGAGRLTRRRAVRGASRPRGRRRPRRRAARAHPGRPFGPNRRNRDSVSRFRGEG